MLEIPDINDVFKDALVEMGDWIVASVEPRMSWPTKAQKVRYRGTELWVLPVTKGHYPGIALNCRMSISREDAERTIMRFLSALSWIEGGGVSVEGFTGGNLPRPLGRTQKYGITIQEDFDLSYLPEPFDEKALLALALIREGRGLNHPAYAFLSFYRVLEVAIPDLKTRDAWITAHVDLLRHHNAKEAVAALRGSGVLDIARHLYGSGRCAIAHAKQKPIIDPDDPRDTRRLSSELPIMAALAELAIERELGVETTFTIYDKHLYELEGFKKLLGPDLLARIGKPMADGKQHMIAMPLMSIELRGREPYPPLTDLVPIELQCEGGLVVLTATSPNGCFGFRCFMDFATERVHFRHDADLICKDDGSAEGADGIAEVGRFIRDYVANGQLRIVNAETGALISRKDAFIPVNVILNPSACNAQILHWKGVAKERRERAA